MRRFLVAGLLLSLLLGLSTRAGAAKPESQQVKRTAKPISALAMDGPRLAYMRSDGRVYVWNVVSGATSEIKGTYPSNGRKFGFGTGEVAIAGKRVALITRFEIGNTLQTQERLYSAAVGGSARQIGKLTNHSSSFGDCTVPDSGGSFGDWLGGLVGSGKALMVSSWKSDGAVSTDERLSLVAPTGLRTIATGPGAVVSQSADGSHVAVLRSTDAWPAYQGPAEQGTPLVGVYSTDGTLLDEIALDVPPPDSCGYSSTIVRIALSGNRLVVLRLTLPQAGSLTSELEVYDWTTGELQHTWPLALSHGSPGTDRVAVHGRVAVLTGGAFRVRLLDLATGKTVTIAAGRSGSPATIGSRGLVYAVNPYKAGQAGKLVFVPTARLLGLLG